MVWYAGTRHHSQPVKYRHQITDQTSFNWMNTLITILFLSLQLVVIQNKNTQGKKSWETMVVCVSLSLFHSLCLCLKFLSSCRGESSCSVLWMWDDCWLDLFSTFLAILPCISFSKVLSLKVEHFSLHYHSPFIQILPCVNLLPPCHPHHLFSKTSSSSSLSTIVANNIIIIKELLLPKSS